MLKSDVDLGEYDDQVIIEQDEEDQVEVVKEHNDFNVVKTTGIMDIDADHSDDECKEELLG